MNKKLAVLLPVSALLVVAGCVSVPVGPMVRVMPGTGKSFDQFQIDDSNCRNYAYNSIGGQNAVQPGQNAAARDLAVASALGAAAGAAIGAVSGQAGAGAAIGAGSGLLFGGAAGANTSGYSSYQLQRSYDTSYLQCMYSRGHQVPGYMASRTPVYSYPQQSYPSPSYPSQGYPQGNPVPPGVGSDSAPVYNYPPPNTPPPRTM